MWQASRLLPDPLHCFSHDMFHCVVSSCCQDVEDGGSRSEEPSGLNDDGSEVTHHVQNLSVI